MSRIGNDEMGNLMRQVVNRQYTFQGKANDLHFLAMTEVRSLVTRRLHSRASALSKLFAKHNIAPMECQV